MAQNSSDTDCPTCGKDRFDSNWAMKIHHKMKHGTSLAETVSLECVVCNDSYERHPSQEEDSRFCSPKCQSTAKPTTHSKSPLVRGEYWAQQRFKAKQRDEFLCQECGVFVGHNSSVTAHVHHITPVSEGGSHKLENLVTLCADCHSETHRRLPLMTEPSSVMAIGRALITETEKEYLAGEHGDQRRYEARSRLKSRITEQLSEDIEFLDNEQPDLLALLEEVVCEGDNDSR